MTNRTEGIQPRRTRRDKDLVGRPRLWVFSVMLLGLLAGGTGGVRADSVVVFNEIMYHPPSNEAALEWVELHNQMAVNVDLSRWSLSGGIDFAFPEGTVIPGQGYLVIASSPADLMAVTGLTNVLGPFQGRLANNGERLELRNNNQRLMARVTYGVEGDWPVAPDGSGVSLAKRTENAASEPAANWTMSAEVGGTPGRRNFHPALYETTQTTPLLLDATWAYEASGSDWGTAWREPDFDDSGWPTGAGLFKAGNVNVPVGDPEPIPGVSSTGMNTNGTALAPGMDDPHYQLTQSPHSTPPPPPIAAKVVQPHPAWIANDPLSGWIGPVNPGTENVAPGDYHYRTTFSLAGFDVASAALTFRYSVDDRLSGVRLNGHSQGITGAGFGTLSGIYRLTNGFVSGLNTLEFQTLNDGTGVNPAGFRVQMSGTARKQLASNTLLPAGRTHYYFRGKFVVPTLPQLAAVRLRPLVADGAVCYLNGTEVWRWNLPDGPITATTPALANVPNPVLFEPFALPSHALVAGTNVLAVELHSAVDGRTNVLFGAELELTTTNLLGPLPFPLALNELSGAAADDFWVELINYGEFPLDLAGCLLARRGGGGKPDYVFPSQILAPGERLQVTQATLGFGAEAGQRLFLYRPGGQGVLDAVVVPEALRGRWPEATGRWWFPAAPTPGASNHFVFRDEVVINEIMYHPPDLPPAPAVYATNLLVSITNTWKYHALGLDLGGDWRGLDYNDQAWPQGRSLFYNTASFLPADKNTELPLVTDSGERIITWYFRTPFVYPGGTNDTQLTFNPIIDDGAVYYLNGVEIHRQNMPAGAIHYATLASAGVATPTYSGPFTVSVSNLVVGTNLLAVEVHQFTTSPIAADMAFGLEVSNFGWQSPPRPARESPDTWVELYNRSVQPVDLTGWRLEGGIEFAFAPGTTLPADGYLVVAKDVGYMQSHYPDITVVGPYAKKLSRRSDALMLKDATGNPADEVRYFDGGRWPAKADGGGSSLELRDPWADNAKPEAWAASDETARSEWVSCSYRGIAQNVLGPTLWNEFVLGLLEAGECLIDDLQVIESPSTAPVALLQNGTFETGLNAWRALGNHSASQVIVDPDNPGNHVLHLKATGPTGHLHNHLETTYAGGKEVVEGREYEISFRAKWLAGNNRLNTRLYFNRVAKTTVLPLPVRRGTPGAPNSTRVPNLGPTFDAFHHYPVIPAPNQSAEVRVNVSDPQGVTNVNLHWSTNGAAWHHTPMMLAGFASTPGYAGYSGAIPGQPAGTLVQFYVQAQDGLGASATFPFRGTNSRALYRVDDGLPVMTQLHRVRLLMTPADVHRLHAPTNVMSNDLMGLTVVYDENEVFYDVGVHLQGSERGRNSSGRVGFTVRFHEDQLFRGTQRSLVIDRSGGYSGLGGRHDEILLWHALNHAGGGVLGIECDLVQVFAPRSQEHGTGLLRLAAFNNDYFDSQFPDGGAGARYMMELIYYPQKTLVDGDPQSPKLPQPDEVINISFQDWGDDAENYRWIFLQENHADRDDYRDIIALNQAFSLTGADFETQLRQRTDVDQWMRTLAFKVLNGDVDTYTLGLNHNWKIYFRPEDGRALGLLWDMDHAFMQSVSAGFPGGSCPNTHRFIKRPDHYRRYYHHLLDLVTTTMNAAHLGPWAAHYAGLLGQNWSGAVNYIQQRGDYVRSTMPPPARFAITSNGGKNFATTNDPVTLTGTAPLTVQTIEVNGVRRPVTWTSLTNWTLTAPLPGFVNLLSLQGVDSRGNPLTDALAAITVTNLGPTRPAPVVINEWMAANAGPGGFADPADGLFQDWFELYNPNDVAVNLSGFHLTDKLSQPAKWPIPAGVVIAPRGFLLVWADGDTEQNRLGADGDLHANFSLSRSGEAIGLYAPDGTPQHVVVFGPQVENVSQGLFPDGNTNAVYFMPDWTPRAANRLGAPAAPTVGAIVRQPDGAIQFQSTVIAGRTYQVEFKDDLSAPDWTPLGGYHPATSPVLTITDLPGDQPQRFYRLLLLP
ncbi:MAG: CotH protein [Verrucomicrobia bacterium ADurb.Bin118]|nr:MAG: CotH protein [Verrucomicrobia bacterium ADurb.Bin118]